jgi:DNA topoisomerase-1
MKLFIVESPGKVKKIQDFLGSDFKVAASYGHVRDLPKKEIAVKPPDFVPKYVPNEKGEKVLGKLAVLAKNASAVYLATDPDREGEYIAWHLVEALGIKNPKRITYAEITKTAVMAALDRPGVINQNLVASAACRRVLDRLVGYMVSPIISNQAGDLLTAGRVQSPALRMVVDREREIRTFKVTVHYGVEMIFDGWKAVWQPKHGWLAEGQEYILDQALADQVARLRKLDVLDCQESESKTAPPAPFITSTLQQAGSSSLKLSPKKTMELAQKLYEDGHITYMRTDSPNLSQEAIDEIRQWAEQHGFPLPVSPRKWKSKADAQEAHEAIRPTHVEVEEAGESDEHKALYRLIRLRAIASQLNDAIYAVCIVMLGGEIEGKSVKFEAKGRTLIRPGWKALVAADATEEDTEEEAENQVPKLTPGQITAADARILTKKTKAPSRYTEASLIKELERRGIGRPSTYAAILENITGREYIKIEKRSLVSTSLGEKVVDAMAGRFSFLDYDFTTRLEDELDQVVEGKTEYLAVVTAAHAQLSQEIKGFIHKFAHKCPDCGRPLRHMKRSDSKEKKGYDFWSCSGFPDHCQASFECANGKPGARKEKKEQQLSGFDCPCGKPLYIKKGIGRDKKPYELYQCSGFPKCKKSFFGKNGQPDFGKKK